MAKIGLGPLEVNVIMVVGEEDDLWVYFLLVLRLLLVAFMNYINNTLQKLISYSYFVKKIKFQLIFIFLTLFHVQRKK